MSGIKTVPADVPRQERGLSPGRNARAQHIQNGRGIYGLSITNQAEFPGGRLFEGRTADLEFREGYQGAPGFWKQPGEENLQITVIDLSRGCSAWFILEYEQ